MVVILIAATVLSAGICVYHLIYAKRILLTPLLNAHISLQSKQMLRCLFHCLSVFFVTSTFAFLACALKIIPGMYAFSLLLFIGMNYGVFAIWQLYIAILSPPNSGNIIIIKALVFLLTAIFAVLGPLISMT